MDNDFNVMYEIDNKDFFTFSYLLEKYFKCSLGYPYIKNDLHAIIHYKVKECDLND